MEPGQSDQAPTATAVPLEVVRECEVTVRAGRKRKLTPAKFEKIMAAIEDGAEATAACRNLGLSQKTLFKRAMRDQEAAKRYAEAGANSRMWL
jgi:hypothetical protein